MILISALAPDVSQAVATRLRWRIGDNVLTRTTRNTHDRT
jgi:hypothetical protein